MWTRRKLLGCRVVHLYLTLLWGSLHLVTTWAALEQPKTYIISLDPSHKPSPFSTHESWHQAILDSFTSSSISSSTTSLTSKRAGKLIYSYNQAFHGFSARLTPSELKTIEKSLAHRATFDESNGKVLTTRSPQFLGLNFNSGVWPDASFGREVIIGILDTGVWPESKSFNDAKYNPTLPSRWRGECEAGESFNKSMCNLKLIGARSFSKGFKAEFKTKISKQRDYDSPRDYCGHGTHTASTAAGTFVENANYFGYASGTAEGIAPFARLAIYKVAWYNAATSEEDAIASDVLAGIDKAIVDGVDIISISLAFDNKPYYDDPLAIGALRAVNKGIFVVCASGNNGLPKSTHNGAPWITTVGAGTIDRSISAELTLGHNDLKLKGTSYYPRSSFHISNLPLFYARNNGKRTECYPSSISPEKGHGKVILCDLMNLVNNRTDFVERIKEVNRTGARAAIFLMNAAGPMLEPTDFRLPIVVISSKKDAHRVLNYTTKETKLMVKELKFGFTDEGIKPAPKVAHFSSRGPDPISPTILKPDILGPGRDILAAWVPNRPFLTVEGEELKSEYVLASGSSMAAPHIAGVAALLKAKHPLWTPAAIRSAMMTTAKIIDNDHLAIIDELTDSPANPLDFGAGFVRPNEAIDPGLIYNIEYKDYCEFLCTFGYTKWQMEAITGGSHWKCNSSSADLNYPSFVAVFTNVSRGSPMVKTFKRVVTNVGVDKAVYNAFIAQDPGMTIRVEPNVLKFTQKYQNISFTLKLELNMKVWNSSFHRIPQGFLRWVDQPAKHEVSSPVVAIL
ncbi:hypothetical protein H6P81_015350 [Aristolochia fimbriata]|uniref:Uncharacterized protein n=1 Tax=Aristolochia fimbriata TaxID=158543 RepID=A0AAV7E7D4_ARIFI|nr:hypothetical protein H6P81_015350 [Aristolochia fimbriata]